MRYPSGGGGDLDAIVEHRNTQAVVHDEGVTVYHPGSWAHDVDGLVDGQDATQRVARQVANVTTVDTTQVALSHDRPRQHQGAALAQPRVAAHRQARPR